MATSDLRVVQACNDRLITTAVSAYLCSLQKSMTEDEFQRVVVEFIYAFELLAHTRKEFQFDTAAFSAACYAL